MDKNKNELRVGLFIIIPVFMLLVFIVFKLGYSVAASTMDIYLKVDSIASIKEGTQVKIKGYTVGRVVEIIPVYKPELHFLAVMRIKKDLALYEDCSAIIQNQNIIGDPVVEIRNPELKGEVLRNGAVLEGLEYVNLETVLQDVHVLLTTLTGTVDVVKGISQESRGNIRDMLGRLSNSMGTVDKLLMDSQADILASLKAFRETATTMQQISKELEAHPVKFLTK